MAPSPQDETTTLPEGPPADDGFPRRPGDVSTPLLPLPPGHDVVISGIAGSFPDSADALEFKHNLYNKVDLVSGDDRRWKLDHPEIPQRTGKLKEVTKFDASFFGVKCSEAHTMDPMGRMVLEKTFEAIIDAGLNPADLHGTRTGVFMGACFSETEKTWFYDKSISKGLGIIGCSRSMLANRISSWLDLSGPSYTVDSACSSSLMAVEHAYRAMTGGVCDAALVGGANLCLHPYVSLQFSRLGVLSPEGRCKSFDDKADGYTRSEAICMILLQKSKDAKRIYAQIVHAKTNCDGYKPQGITYPSGEMQSKLLRETYLECEIKPREVAFVEAHGTGTKVGDPEEVAALDEVFCKGRIGSLPIGSVKSNIGHSEPASGLCSITKMCLSMECGKLLPNLHYNTPREGVKALEEGVVKVVTEPQSWDGGLAGINSFGFGGANVHVLLKSNDRQVVNNVPQQNDIPLLVCISGRNETGVSKLLDGLQQKNMLNDNEETEKCLELGLVGLVQSAFRKNIPNHLYRGFAILDQKGSELSRHSNFWGGVERSIVYIFSGFEFKNLHVYKNLSHIPIFKRSIQKSHHALLHFGIDLESVLSNPEKYTVDNPIYTSVAVASIQIGIVDVLKIFNISPDFIVGFLLGEFVCGYADGCLTLEQAIIASFYRSKAILEADISSVATALIQLEPDEVSKILPKGFNIICNASTEYTLVAGSYVELKSFVNTLTQRNISAEIQSIKTPPFYSKDLQPAADKLIQYLKLFLPKSIKASSKWLRLHEMTEVNVENIVKSLLAPVNFTKLLEKIPANAVCVEISPNGCLKSFFKRVPGCSYLALLQNSEQDPCKLLLEGVGRMYTLGQMPNVSVLSPPSFPVPRGTPMISHLIEWVHTQEWYVTSYRTLDKSGTGERTVSVSILDEEGEFLIGHIIDGRNLYPATAYLTLVWETFGLMLGELYTNVSVIFEDVRFLRATNLPHKGNIHFNVMIQTGTGRFEVSEGGSAVVTGRIYTPLPSKARLPPPKKVHFDIPDDTEHIPLSRKDLYKELRLRGYNYQGVFKGVQNYDTLTHTGKIQWINNWVAFMDNMLQLQIVFEDTRGLYVPTAIQKLQIDIKSHVAEIHAMGEEKAFTVHLNPYAGIIRAGGVEITGLRANAIPKRKPAGEPVLEKYLFIPNNASFDNADESIRCFVQLALENVHTIKVKCVELLNEVPNISDENEKVPYDPSSLIVLSPLLQSALADLPLVQADVRIVIPTPTASPPDFGMGITVEDKKLQADSNCVFVVGKNLLGNEEVLNLALSALRQGGFVISREPVSNSSDDLRIHKDVNVICKHFLKDETLFLLQKKIPLKPICVVKIEQNDSTYGWLKTVQSALKTGENRVVLLAENEKTNGILGLINCIRKEPGGDNAKCVFIMDEAAPAFDLDNPLFKDQLDLDLGINVFKDGCWGTYRHMPLESENSALVTHCYVNVMTRGDLSSLKWIEGPIKVPKAMKDCKPDDLLVQIYYSALNFRDVMTATGKLATEVVANGRLNQECVQGLEFAGRTMQGRRVMGLVSCGALATAQTRDPWLSWDIPVDWDMRDGATVPIVYSTAYYALVLAGEMTKGQTILIHAGSGGVGQAAISIALHAGCRVLTTVGTAEKRKFLLERYPELTEEDIGNSRDTTFEQLVMRRTKGRGVDLVLNSLAGEKLIASLRCLGRKGRFLEIGKFDLASDNILHLGVFTKEQSFHGVTLEHLFVATTEEKIQISKMVANGIIDGSVRPLSRTVFEIDEVEQAFRYMAAGKHIGKVLVKLRPEEPEQVIFPEPLCWPALPRFYCDPNRSYVIIGGLGGFGLELADWLVLRGAKHIVLNSRRGIVTGYQASRVRTWRGYGVGIHVSKDDVVTEQGCMDILNLANNIAPVASILNLAVVLQDAILENQNEEKFEKALAPKAAATIWLDKISRELCPDLMQFIVFSSVSCGRGNAGQTNYGMANSVMERICEERYNSGLPALAVQWGAVGEVGLVADLQDDHKELEIGGTLQQRISSCLSVLDTLLGSQSAKEERHRSPIVSSMVVAEKRSGAGGAGGLVHTVLNILGLRDIKTVSPHSTLAELGMDSLMAVEIKQALEREFEVFLSPQDIRSLSFARLSELANQREAEADAGSPGGNESQKLNAIPTGTKGVKLLLKMVGDESKAHLPVVHLPSATLDKEPLVMIIPGIEGSASIMNHVAHGILARVECLQLPIPQRIKTCKELADDMLPHALAMLPERSSFHFVAYSYGSLVLLELVLMLEAEGRTGHIVLIDGAPELLKGMVDSFLIPDSEQSEETQLQLQILIGVLDHLAPGDHAIFKEALFKIPDWSSRVDALVSLAPEVQKNGENPISSQYSMPYLRALCDIMLIRAKSTKYNDESQLKETKIKSQITLIKPTEMSLPGMQEDYNLSQFTDKKIHIFYVEGNHASIVENTKCCEIINESFQFSIPVRKPSIVAVEENVHVSIAAQI